MRTYQRQNFSRTAVIAAAVVVAVAAQTQAAVKVIGDWEGSMASGYSDLNWTTGANITVAPQFISTSDPNYQGGVTRGQFGAAIHLS